MTKKKISRDHICFCNIPPLETDTRSVRFLLKGCLSLSRTRSKEKAASFKKHISISNSCKETINEPELSGKTGT